MKGNFKSYISILPRIILIYLGLTIQLVIDQLMVIKDEVVRRMFWGRGSLYKTSFHLIIGFLTLTALASGISSRLLTANASALTAAQIDTLLDTPGAQGSNIQAVAPISTLATFSIRIHSVTEEDTLAGLVTRYGVSKDTIKWSNSRLLSPYSDELPPNSQLLIPDVDGVLYEVRNGDDFNKVLSVTSGDRATVIDVNGLNENNLAVEAGQLVFVPGGKLPPPPVLGKAKPVAGGYIAPDRSVSVAPAGFPLGAFDSPLTHPQCVGYHYSRGISLTHTGVDLAKGGGCPIRAIANGRVKQVGWIARAGWSVIIDHGNGVESHYYHGYPNSFWVSQGEQVSKGQNIMYMGNSGNSTGTHLHLTLKINGSTVDPFLYVPYSVRR